MARIDERGLPSGKSSLGFEPVHSVSTGYVADLRATTIEQMLGGQTCALFAVNCHSREVVVAFRAQEDYVRHLGQEVLAGHIVAKVEAGQEDDHAQHSPTNKEADGFGQRLMVGWRNCLEQEPEAALFAGNGDTFQGVSNTDVIESRGDKPDAGFSLRDEALGLNVGFVAEVFDDSFDPGSGRYSDVGALVEDARHRLDGDTRGLGDFSNRDLPYRTATQVLLVPCSDGRPAVYQAGTSDTVNVPGNVHGQRLTDYDQRPDAIRPWY